MHLNWNSLENSVETLLNRVKMKPATKQSGLQNSSLHVLPNLSKQGEEGNFSKSHKIDNFWKKNCFAKSKFF